MKKLLPIFALVLAGCASPPVYQSMPVEQKEIVIGGGSHGERYYWVTGEVLSPGTKLYVGETTLTRAISAAGGFTAEANRNQLEIHRINGSTMRYSYSQITTTPTNDPSIWPGDKVDVPRR